MRKKYLVVGPVPVLAGCTLNAIAIWIVTDKTVKAIEH